MDKSTQLTRSCLACGLEKPISAFLQLSGTQGTVYGNICATCRSANAKDKKIVIPKQEEEAGRGSSGLKIDAKTRIEVEKKQKLEKKQLEELGQEELEKRDQLALDKAEQTEKKEREQKAHRQNYIEGKQKPGFLSHTQPKTEATGLATPADRQALAQENKRVEDALAQDNLTNNVDVNTLHLDSNLGKTKFQSVNFRKFKAWLGDGANFNTLERLYKSKNTADAKAAKETKSAPSEPFVELERKNSKTPGRK